MDFEVTTSREAQHAGSAPLGSTRLFRRTLVPATPHRQANWGEAHWFLQRHSGKLEDGSELARKALSQRLI